MPTYVRKATALTILKNATSELQTDYPDLLIFRKKTAKDRPGSSFGITNDRRQYMNIDTRPVQKSINPFISLQTVMHTCLELYHEEGHLFQFKQGFKQKDPVSKHLAQTALISRCMPEYREAIYKTNPVEMDAERYGLLKTQAYFEHIGYDPALVDRTLTDIINQDSLWYADRPVKDLDDAISKLEAGIEKSPEQYPPDTKALYIKLNDGPSDMCRTIQSDPKLRAAYETGADRGNNRAKQQTLLMEYIKTHPTEDRKLFPNLDLERRGHTPRRLPEQFAHIQNFDQYFHSNGDSQPEP